MKIGFIGFGHMAGAMAKGLIRGGFSKPSDLYACASDYERLAGRLAASEGSSNSENSSDGLSSSKGEDSISISLAGMNACKTASDVVSESDVVIVAVKPNQVEGVLTPIKIELARKIVISVAFGWDFERYEKVISGAKHISIIPNTPCEVCMGMTIIEDKHNLDESELELVEDLLSSFGEIAYFPADKMWLAGEVTSCGPAFAAMFIEALGDAGAKYGLDKEDAYRIVSQMVAGTGVLQIETEKNPGTMVNEVATPGGVTIKGVKALREANFHEVVAKAIDAIEK
ncbi:MAG: pyrroline-5-carboxylate reductase [Firmicutes bacterium]|nr:pyrroline-5-carboxylate reductase [Bacillota bacterium]